MDSGFILQSGAKRINSLSKPNWLYMKSANKIQQPLSKKKKKIPRWVFRSCCPRESLAFYQSKYNSFSKQVLIIPSSFFFSMLSKVTEVLQLWACNIMGVGEKKKRKKNWTFAAGTRLPEARRIHSFYILLWIKPFFLPVSSCWDWNHILAFKLCLSEEQAEKREM